MTASRTVWSTDDGSRPGSTFPYSTGTLREYELVYTRILQGEVEHVALERAHIVPTLEVHPVRLRSGEAAVEVDAAQVVMVVRITEADVEHSARGDKRR